MAILGAVEKYKFIDTNSRPNLGETPEVSKLSSLQEIPTFEHLWIKEVAKSLTTMIPTENNGDIILIAHRLISKSTRPN